MNNKPTDTAICHTKPLVTILTALFLLFSFSLANAQTTIDTSFLDSNANADGSISLTGDVSQPYQSTAESIITYGALGQSDATAAVNGRAYLDSITVNSTENLALRLLTSPLNAPNFNATLAEINQRQNHDGGVGAFTDFGSDLISTSFALRALSRARVVNAVSGRVVSYLLAQQNTDGSWSLQDNPNRVETTALVVNALWLYRQSYSLGDALSNGVAYLASQRGADNLWEEVEGSALALSAILNVEVDRSAYQTSLANFANLQNSNGSFSDDVYLTALGLRVLDATEKPAPDEIVLSGRVVDGDSGTPLAGAAIQLTGASSVSQVSDTNGAFELNNLPAGNYSLSVSIDGFGELTLNTLLTLGAKANLGDLQLSRLQIDPDTGDPVTTGIVRGTITDRRTNAPLSGATVSVVGASLSATTNAAGEYQLSAVPSGTVQLNASAAGFSSASGSANLSAGQTLIFSPSLQEQTPVGVSLQGSITDRLSGSPLAGVQIQVTDGDSQSQTATTDANGAYSIEGIVAGEISIQATLIDYHPVSVTTTVEDGARLVFSPQMDLLSQDPAATASGLTGVVIDAVTGRGLQLVQLTLAYDSGESFTQVSGQDGEFTFTELPQGSATITVELAGYTTLSGTLDTQSGLITNIGTVELQPENAPLSGSLVGQVVDVRSRQAISGAIISARNTINNALTEVMGDAQGQFALASLAEGEYEITVSFTDYNSQVFTAVVSAGTDLDLGEIRLRQPGVDALLADLAITELDISQVQSSQVDFVVSGTVSGVMVNRGNVSVSVPLDVVAFEDVNRDGEFTEVDTLLGSSSIAFDRDTALDVDSAAAFSIDVSGVQSFHDAPITVFVDANNVIAELSEANNTNSTAGLCVNQQQGPSLDLAICMDSSGSVSSSEFQLQLEGTALAVENENIVPRDGSVRVSAIQFSSSSFVELNPTIIEEDNATDVADAIRAIRKRGGGTSIHSCIDTANSLITGATPASALQVIDVSTDGQSSQSAAIAASNRAMDAGIDVLNSIGVGSGVNVGLLDSIVFPQPSGGDRGFVITVSNFQEYIDGIAGKIQRETRIPDLTVGGLALTDNGSGANATATLTIGNGGSGDISGAVVIRLYNGSPDQGGQLLVEQSYTNGLLSGESAPVTIEGIVPADITAGELVVEVALEEGFAECNQDNNRQQIAVTSLLGDISLNLGGTVFGSNTDIDLATQIANTGSLEGNYTVALIILDAARIEVASVAAFDVTALPPTESISFSNLWNTGTATSGNYIAQATLLDVDGNVLDTAEASFTISDLTDPDGTPNGNPAAALRATTDRPFYHVDDQVQLDALAENITAIHPITNPELLMIVTDASGSELFNETVALSSLAPGQIAEAMRALNLVQAAEGVYQYQVTLLGNGGTSFATATASFEVLNDLNAAIRGTVAAQAPEVSQGDSQACTFTTLNTGTQDLSALAVNYRVLNVDAQTTVTNDTASLDLAAGGSTNQLQSFSTSGFAPGNYACVLEATLDGESRSLAYGQFTVIETPINIVVDLQVSTSPRLLVLVDPLQETCTANRSVTLEGEFSQVIGDSTEVYSKVFGKHKYHGPKDYELAMPADFAGDTPVDEVNHNDGHPDIAITALTNERIQITLSSKNALAGQYQLLHYVSDYGWHPQLESGLIDFNCGAPLQVGQTVSELTVVDTDTVELLAANDNKHPPYGHAYGHKHRHDREHKKAETPALETQYSVLEALLAGRAYTLVDNTDDFEMELLSGQYQQYLLLSERQSLDHFTAKFLREAVNRGEGLVLASGRAPKAEPLWEALSIASPKRHHKGKGWDDDDDYDDRHSAYSYRYPYRQLQAEGVRLLESPIATAEDVLFGLERPLPYVALDQATLAGSFLNPEVIKGKHKHHYDKGWRYREDDDDKDDDKDDDDYRGHHNHHNPLPQDVPAVTLADYGQGKAIFIGYDVLAEITHLGLDASVNQHADLLINSLNFTAPTTLPQRPGSVVPVQLTLENLGSETPVTATLLWPLGSQLLDSVPAATTENELATWALDLATNQSSTLTSWAIPEYVDNSALVVAEVFIGNDTTQDPYQRLELTLQPSDVESLEVIKQDLVALIDAETNRYHKRQLKKALHWLKKAEHFYDKGRLEKVFTKLLYATNHLKAVDTSDLVALRLRVDELLWQWGQQVSEGRAQP